MRPSSHADGDAVLSVIAARDLRDFGAEGFVGEMLVDQWRVGEFEPATDAAVAVQDGLVVGYAALFTPGALVFVDPGHEGHGIGSALLSWVEALATARGRETHRQPLPERNAGAQELLSGAGYRRARSVVKMKRNLGASPAMPSPPPGITLDRLDVARDARAVYEADAAAFADSADYEPQSFSAFCDEHLATPELDPSLSCVAHRGDAVAGFALCRRRREGIGYVDLLAVQKPERGQGLGTALLLTVFAAFAQSGLSEARLEVASDNPGAFRIYERAGMTPSDRVEVFEKPTARAPAEGPITIVK